MKSEIQVTGLHCSGCEMVVTEALEEMDGVMVAKASHETGTVDVEFDDTKVTLDAIKSVIEEQGYRVTA
jgi:copper chaperone